jgi:hypothetical protein
MERERGRKSYFVHNMRQDVAILCSKYNKIATKPEKDNHKRIRGHTATRVHVRVHVKLPEQKRAIGHSFGNLKSGLWVRTGSLVIPFNSAHEKSHVFNTLTVHYFSTPVCFVGSLPQIIVKRVNDKVLKNYLSSHIRPPPYPSEEFASIIFAVS